MVAARMEAIDFSGQVPEQDSRGANPFQEAVALVAEALEAVALAEQRTKDAEDLNEELAAHCSERLRDALQRARSQELRAELAERKAAVLTDCLRTICEALRVAGD